MGLEDRSIHPSLALRLSFGDEALDGKLELFDGSEHAAFEAPIGEFSNEAFDSVEPVGGGWREVEGPARVLGEPFLDLRMLVGSVIVDNHADPFTLGDLRVASPSNAPRQHSTGVAAPDWIGWRAPIPGCCELIVNMPPAFASKALIWQYCSSSRLDPSGINGFALTRLGRDDF